MEKDIEKIINDKKDMRFLAYFRYSHPVVVLHLSYEAETTDGRYALERFIVRILDNLKDKDFPTVAIAHLCGVDVPIVEKIIRDMTDEALITVDRPGVYKVLDTTKTRYFENKKPRKLYDKDLVIDSISRETLPLQVYAAANWNLQIYRNRPDDEIDSIAMTLDECKLFEDKLGKASETRKMSLDFPSDADKFIIKNTTAAQLPGFYVVYFISDKGLIKQLYYGDRPIETSFADMGALKFGLSCKNGKFIRINNMPEGILYDKQSTGEGIDSILAEEFKSDSSCGLKVTDASRNIVAITFDLVSKLKDKSGVFECLAKGYKDCIVYYEHSNCGEVRIYLECGDEKIKALLKFYRAIRRQRKKECIMSVAQSLNLSWRKAMLDTGYYKLLEDIDITDYIYE